MLLRAWIRLYRRRLRSRGPFRNVRCSFENAESCSSYGLRIASEPGSSWRAVRLIRARLKRCRHASLYRTQRHLMWGRLYDDHPEPEALREALQRAGEREDSIAMVLLSAAWTARYTGDMRRCKRLLDARHERCAPLLRDGRGIDVRLQRRERRALLFAATLILLPWAIAMWRRARADRHRFDRFEAALRFRGAQEVAGSQAKKTSRNLALS